MTQFNLQIAVSIGIKGEAQRDTAEARQGGNDGGIGVVGSNEVH